MNNDNLGTRMKEYEDVWRIKLPRRMPMIIRLDGKAFHTLLSKAEKPFDYSFVYSMQFVTTVLIDKIQNAVFAYCQSDEISILVHNYKRLNTDCWFDNNLQKIISVSSSIAIEAFYWKDSTANFDARVFVLPEAEVCNYFIWRQQDAIRNSINTVGQSLFSASELHGKNTTQVVDMIATRNIIWKEYPIKVQRGFSFINKELDLQIPKFSEDREYINNLLKIEEE